MAENAPDTNWLTRIGKPFLKKVQSDCVCVSPRRNTPLATASANSGTRAFGTYLSGGRWMLRLIF